MFPRPIQQMIPPARAACKVMLPVALLLWLLPLLGVALTSLLAAGNYFGLPSAVAFSNYGGVFQNSPIGQCIWNSFKATIPTVIGAVAISCVTGFALWVLVFTFIWNDYFWATVLTTSSETQPVTAGLYSLSGQWIAAWHLVSAGSIVAAMPPVLMFFLIRRHFISGLTLGAVK